MFEDPKEDADPGYWPSVSDLFMTLFIVAIAMVFAIYFYATSKKGPGPDFIVEGDGVLKEEIRKPVNHMKKNGLNENELLRPQQPIREVVDALGDTSEKIVEEIIRLKEQIKSQPDDEELAKPEEHLDIAHGEIEGLRSEIEDLKERIREEEGHLDIAHGEIEDLKADNAKLRDLQRIIRIDATNPIYTFDSGSAEMGEEFSNGLAENEFKDLAKRIVNLNRNKNDQLIVDTLEMIVDTLEIIGHTDGENFSHSDKGNLDEKLPEFLAGKARNMALFRAGSNNDLGLMRALAIKRSWGNFIETLGDKEKEELKKIKVRCYSAGQTEPDDRDRKKPESYEMKNKAFRRIEIQLTKRNPE